MSIKYGSSGTAVQALQIQLVKLGLDVGVDGKYGPMTETAVTQAYNMLGVPGVSGMASDELLSALAANVGPGGAIRPTNVGTANVNDQEYGPEYIAEEKVQSTDKKLIVGGVLAALVAGYYLTK